MFDNVIDAISFIENKRKKGKRENLDRIKKLSSILNLKLDYKIIHIAGTNGKGSTAMYINNLLVDLGYKVGLFTSPYIIKFNERIIFNSNYIDDNELLNLINYIVPIIKDYEEKNDDLVPFFEILTLISLIYFENKECDYVILECGIGGRLDATNFITPIASIITSIGYDHMNSLGNTLLDIAYHKAGIIKPNVPVFTIYNNEVNDYLVKVAKENNSELILIDSNKLEPKIDNGVSFNYDNYLFHTPLNGLYQASNASLMIALAKYLFKDISNDFINKTLAKSYIPCRFEIIDNYILDGAHNISAVKSLVNTLTNMNLNNLVCVFASLKDKRYDLVLEELNKVVSTYLFPNFNDLRSTDPNLYLPYINNKEYKILDNIEEAINYKSNLILVTGSLHFVSEFRHHLLKN